MTPKKIRQIAEEYAHKQWGKAIPHTTSDLSKLLEDFTRALAERYCVVERSKVVEYHNQGYMEICVDDEVLRANALGKLQALEDVFGKHNLTAQAEEKPKEPKFKGGDRVIATKGNYVLRSGTIEHYSEDDDTWAVMVDGISYPIHFKESHLELVSHIAERTSPKNSNLSQSSTDWNSYRLDLAKEIAVAMVGANWEPADIPRDAVEDANEIVKRLKETEE